MNHKAFAKTLAIFSMASSPMFLPSLVCALFFLENDMALVFLVSLLFTFGAGALLYLFFRHADINLQQRETLGLVGVGWLLIALYGTLPYIFSGELSLVDGYFESMSGFSTTGASILTDIEILPKSLLFWRSFTHWLGGLGIILLLIIILPHLGAGGKLLYRSEMPGLDKSSFKPRVKDSALFLLRIYFGLTVVMTLVLLIAGMNLFDSLCHTFGTLATGGFSTKNASIAAYQSPLIEFIICLFMLIAGTSFSLIYCCSVGDFKKAYTNGEWRLYLGLLAISFLLITVNIIGTDQPIPGLIGATDIDHGPGVLDKARFAAFQTVSMMTCTGFCTTDFNTWPDFSRMLLLVLMIIGGCSGSTSGGLKVVRVMLLFRMARWHLEQIFRQKHIRIFRVDDTIIPKEVQNSVLMYFTLYIFVLLAATLLLAWMGVPFVTSISAVISCFNGVGPGLDLVGAITNYSFLPIAGKLLLSLVMVMGRLEIYAIGVLFLPSFWKKY